MKMDTALTGVALVEVHVNVVRTRPACDSFINRTHRQGTVMWCNVKQRG